MTTYRKKMIEVALPLEAINKESAREKSIRHGHPSTLHLWWARRPLAACRAVLFSSLVNDPDDDPMYGISEDVAATERAKLFDLIEELVRWENSNNPEVINRARLEIARSIAANKVADKELKDDTPLVANAPELPEEQAKYLPAPPSEYTPRDVRFKMPSLTPEQVNHFLAHYAPPVLDPFAGGGSIPLEAQRLGLRAYASDLNPVAVLINKALIEIPPKFAGMPPVNPKSQIGNLKSKIWQGAAGLADDVRYYGKWMREEAERRIGHLYPKVRVTQQMVDEGRPDLEPYVGQELTVIAWLWARTVKSPNPALSGKHVPLVKGFWLSKKPGQEAFVRPVIQREQGAYEFHVEDGKPQDDFDPNKGTVIRSGARCLISDSPIPFDYIRTEGKADRMKQRLMAIVCLGNRERVYIDPLPDHENLALGVQPDNFPVTDLPEQALSFRVQLYGMDEHWKLFSSRQLMGLTQLSDLVTEAKKQLLVDCNGRVEEEDYAQAVATYLAFAVDKSAESTTTLCAWSPLPSKLHVVATFGRQALPMVWDFAESNPFSDSAGNIQRMANLTSEVIERLFVDTSSCGIAQQCDATAINFGDDSPLISTDPPYYDNIGYADLSDFFYIWLRRSLNGEYSTLFGTVLTPKSDEIISTPFRHGGDASQAKAFFEQRLGQAIDAMRRNGVDRFPLTIFYAFKQSESELDGVASTGWETMLTGVIEAGFAITGTWPVRTERSGGFRNNNQNALASSIVLVCRPRGEDASIVTRRDFANALRKELPEAIKHLQSGNVAPVDLAQASIGPGMAVFSRYNKVINADGSPMSVREALQMINQMLDESLVEQESDFDTETRFALRWFEQFGVKEGPFGDAETLAKAMAVAVNGIVEAGIVSSKSGKVRLLKRTELAADWNPASDKRLTMWESTQHLIRALEEDGETGAADLLAKLIAHKGSAYAESVRELSYRLYQTCDRTKRAEEALSYNGLVVSWPEVAKLCRERTKAGPRSTQQTIFDS